MAREPFQSHSRVGPLDRSQSPENPIFGSSSVQQARFELFKQFPNSFETIGTNVNESSPSYFEPTTGDISLHENLSVSKSFPLHVWLVANKEEPIPLAWTKLTEHPPWNLTGTFRYMNYIFVRWWTPLLYVARRFRPFWNLFRFLFWWKGNIW